MIHMRMPMLAIAALTATGLAAAVDMAQSRPQEATPLSMSPAGEAIALRFPQLDEMMIAKLVVPAQSNVVFAAKAEAAPTETVFVPTEECTHEHWPYIADECLVARDRVIVPRAVRTIKIEQRPAHKVPARAATQLASR